MCAARRATDPGTSKCSALLRAAFVRIRAPRQRFPGQSHVDDVTAVQYIKAPCNISCL